MRDQGHQWLRLIEVSYRRSSAERQGRKEPSEERLLLRRFKHFTRRVGKAFDSRLLGAELHRLGFDQLF